MTRSDSAVLARARQRMLAADDAKQVRPTAWPDWQQAATDYWLLVHPDLAPYRRGDPVRTPTADEFSRRADLVAHAMDDIPDDWRLRPATESKVEQLARVGWFHELLAGLYEPVEGAIDRLRRVDRSGLETLVRFLEADVYCFRSGYMKADVIRYLTRIELEAEQHERLRRVVIDVVEAHDRREFRSYIRLARRVDSADLRDALRERLTHRRSAVVRRATWVLEGLP